MPTSTLHQDPLFADAHFDGADGARNETGDRWQTTIVAIGRRAAAANTDRIAADAAAALAEALALDCSGVAEVAEDGGISMTLSAARAGVHVPAATLTISTRSDDSLVGFALAAGTPIATADLREETRFRDALLRTRQIRGALACPIKSSGRAYGAIVIASLAPCAFSPQDMLCVETIGHLVAGALARSRAEHMLAEQTQVNAAVFDGVDAIVVTLDAEARILNINRSCEAVAGFGLTEVRQRAFRGVFVAPGDESRVARQFDQMLRDRQPAQFAATLLTKHGLERRVAWKFTPLAGGRGAALVGTGVDITEKCELEARLAKARCGATAEASSGQTANESASLGATRTEQPLEPNAAASAIDNANRRRTPRRPYPYQQRMAPIIAGQMPGLDDFREVECHDIGAGGFSYFVEAEPTETEVVVAFGSGGIQTYLTARLLHKKATTHKGRPMYLIGCQYTGRHTYS